METETIAVEKNGIRIRSYIDKHTGPNLDITCWRVVCENAFDIALPFVDDKIKTLIDERLTEIFSPYKDMVYFSRKDYERLQREIQDSVPVILREIYGE